VTSVVPLEADPEFLIRDKAHKIITFLAERHRQFLINNASEGVLCSYTFLTEKLGLTNGINIEL